MQKIQTNGISIAYHIQGTGHPLVLIGGLGYGVWVWHKVLPELAKHFRVIVFDNRGTGDSDKPDGPYNASMMAADTAGLLEALSIPSASITSAYVMGISMGGFIAQELALTRPELVDKLVLAGTHFGGPDAIPPPPETLDIMTNRDGDLTDLLLRGFRVSTSPGWSDKHPEVVAELLAYRLTEPTPPAQYKAQFQVGVTHNTADRLSQIQCPTLILFGADDNVVPAGNAALLAQKIPHAQVKILPNLGHIMPLENPALFAGTITDFLKG